MVKPRLKGMYFLASVAIIGLFIASACGSRQAADTGTENSSLIRESPERRGSEIVAEYLRRDAAPFRKMRVRFTISTDDEPDKIYELDNWRKQTPDATTTMSQIIRPAEDSDLGSLTLEPKGQKATVVTYAASRGEYRETDTNKMFFGGLTAGELLGEWHKFTYRLAGEKQTGGQRAFEVEGRIKPDAYSVVSRMTVLFRADNYFPAEVHFFDNNGREIRSYKVTDLNGDPDHPYAARTEVENPVYKARIVIEILSREFPGSIDDSMFSRDRLKSLAKK